MSRDNAVQELTDLVESQKREPEKYTIAQLVPEPILHQHTSEEVTSAAVNLNLKVLSDCRTEVFGSLSITTANFV